MNAMRASPANILRATKQAGTCCIGDGSRTAAEAKKPKQPFKSICKHCLSYSLQLYREKFICDRNHCKMGRDNYFSYLILISDQFVLLLQRK